MSEMRLFIGGTGTMQSRVPKSDHTTFFRRLGNGLLLAGGLTIASFGLAGRADAQVSGSTKSCGPRINAVWLTPDECRTCRYTKELLVDKEGFEAVEKLVGSGCFKDSLNPLVMEDCNYDRLRYLFDDKLVFGEPRLRQITDIGKLNAGKAELRRILMEAEARVRRTYAQLEQGDKSELADERYMGYTLSKLNVNAAVCEGLINELISKQLKKGALDAAVRRFNDITAQVKVTHLRHHYEGNKAVTTYYEDLLQYLLDPLAGSKTTNEIIACFKEYNKMKEEYLKSKGLYPAYSLSFYYYAVSVCHGIKSHEATAGLVEYAKKEIATAKAAKFEEERNAAELKAKKDAVALEKNEKEKRMAAVGATKSEAQKNAAKIEERSVQQHIISEEQEKNSGINWGVLGGISIFGVLAFIGCLLIKKFGKGDVHRADMPAREKYVTEVKPKPKYTGEVRPNPFKPDKSWLYIDTHNHGDRQ